LEALAWGAVDDEQLKREVFEAALELVQCEACACCREWVSISLRTRLGMVVPVGTLLQDSIAWLLGSVECGVRLCGADDELDAGAHLID
jgi:hypothetical protein